MITSSIRSLSMIIDQIEEVIDTPQSDHQFYPIELLRGLIDIKSIVIPLIDTPNFKLGFLIPYLIIHFFILIFIQFTIYL